MRHKEYGMLLLGSMVFVEEFLEEILCCYRRDGSHDDEMGDCS
jgi:hypothetical protein